MATEARTIQAQAWVDGASRGNPGEAGFGLVFRPGDQVEENRDADR